MAKIIVCCKLPSGFILAAGDQQVKINGANAGLIRGTNNLPIKGSYGKTEVDEALWQAWLKDHKNFPPLVKNAIWVEKDEKSADAKGKELAKEATGLEGLAQDGNDKRLPKGKNKVTAEKDD